MKTFHGRSNPQWKDSQLTIPEFRILKPAPFPLPARSSRGSQYITCQVVMQHLAAVGNERSAAVCPHLGELIRLLFVARNLCMRVH